MPENLEVILLLLFLCLYHFWTFNSITCAAFMFYVVLYRVYNPR